jgi:hypothetical protein
MIKKLITLALLAAASLIASARVIELHGDSTQAAYTALFTPAARLQMQIDYACGPGIHKVVNKGWGATTAKQALSGQPASGMYDGRTFAQYMSTSNADIVIANWGINDNFIPGNNKWLYAYDHTQLAAIAKSYGKVYIVETSNPLFYHAPRDDLIWEWAMTLVEVGRLSGYPVIDQWTWVAGSLKGWQYQFIDGIHPEQSMYDHKAINTFKFLKARGYLC